LRAFSLSKIDFAFIFPVTVFGRDNKQLGAIYREKE